jgi:hypothetical protein
MAKKEFGIKLHPSYDGETLDITPPPRAKDFVRNLVAYNASSSRGLWFRGS